MRALTWLLRALIFFTLFAFALNNQDEAAVRWFFGHEWRAPMVFIVLAAFGAGCAIGILAMLPSWWRLRRLSQQQVQRADTATTVLGPAVTRPVEAVAAEHPPRDGV